MTFIPMFQALPDIMLRIAAGESFVVMESGMLPFPETFPACDVESHMEVDIPTGNMIHVVLHEENFTLLLSKKVYEGFMNSERREPITPCGPPIENINLKSCTDDH